MEPDPWVKDQERVKIRAEVEFREAKAKEEEVLEAAKHWVPAANVRVQSVEIKPRIKEAFHARQSNALHVDR
ncbi:MAG: hypothetical protein ABIE74_00685 [Pseudomonadota bacterium]